MNHTKHILSSVIAIFFAMGSFAQVTFYNSYNEGMSPVPVDNAAPNKMMVLEDGYIVAGLFLDDVLDYYNTHAKAFYLKTNLNGDLLWLHSTEIYYGFINTIMLHHLTQISKTSSNAPMEIS
jgi:hypothetical protein